MNSAFAALRQDMRYAVRVLRRRWSFALNVAATIGLGLGLLGSAFTLVNTYLLRPIDLPQPHTLYSLGWTSANVRGERFTLTDLDELRGLTALKEIAGGQEATVMDNGTAVAGLLVTGNYFRLLGASPLKGRLLLAADASARGTAPVVVLSERTWRVRYGSDPSIVGQRVSLGRERFEVIGVAPAAATLSGQESVAFWAPVTMAGTFAGIDPLATGSSPTLFAVARVQPGVTSTQLRSAFDGWLRRRFPASSERAPVSVRVDSLATRIPFTGPTVGLVVVLLSAFGLVLLVACANVTNLMLARAFSRQQEIAIRMSLGARRAQIARQLMVESLVLAVPAAVVGVAITAALARAFPAFVLATFPANVLPVDTLLAPLDLDLRVLIFLAAAAVAAAVVVSLAPTARMMRTEPARAARGDASLDPRRSRLRSALVAAQVAASVLFLVGAMGLTTEFRRVGHIDPGIPLERVTWIRVDPQFRPALAARLANDPAVETVAVAWRPPLVGGGALPTIQAKASTTGVSTPVGFMAVSPEYFAVFDIDITAGRAFTRDEAREGAAVAMVSKATAQAFWPNTNAIGQTLALTEPPTGRAGRRPPYTSVRVIGVTEDVTNGSLFDGHDRTCVYFVADARMPGDMALLARSRTDSTGVRQAVTNAMNVIAPGATVGIVALLEMLGTLTWVFGALSATAGGLGIIGLLLACSGTYAVVSYLVALRTREFGVRMAIGATGRHIVEGMLREAFRTGGAGMAIGAIAVFALARLSSGTVPLFPDPGALSYLLGVGMVGLATAAAAIVPAMRAGSIDPVQALRVD
jgi:predicted permease